VGLLGSHLVSHSTTWRTPRNLSAHSTLSRSALRTS
jgi:hypothetical protein